MAASSLPLVGEVLLPCGQERGGGEEEEEKGEGREGGEEEEEERKRREERREKDRKRREKGGEESSHVVSSLNLISWIAPHHNGLDTFTRNLTITVIQIGI